MMLISKMYVKHLHKRSCYIKHVQYVSAKMIHFLSCMHGKEHIYTEYYYVGIIFIASIFFHACMARSIFIQNVIMLAKPATSLVHENLCINNLL